MGRCIVYTGIRLLLLIHPFISSFFFLSSFQTLRFFVTLFSGTMRPRRLKLGTHVDSRWMYHVYRNQAAALIHPFISSFFFLSNFQTLKFLVTLFSGTVRPRRLKLGTHVDTGQMYCAYQNQAAAAYSSLYSFFFLSNFQTLKYFVTLFSGTVRPRRLKLGTHMDSVQMYHVFRNQAAAAYSSLYFFSFLSLQFSNIKNFCCSFLKNCEIYKVETWYTHVVDVSCLPQSGCYFLFVSYFFIFFLSNVQKLKIFVTLFSGTVRPR